MVSRIRYIEGDLFEAPESHLMHGCNALGAYGSGVAGIMRRVYPDAYEAYRQQFESPEGLHLGQLIVAQCGRHTIINAVTQYNYGGKPGVVYVDYDRGIRQAFRNANTYAETHRVPAIALPLIGAGLAGGSWSKIAAIIEEEATAFVPVVYLIDGIIPQ